MARKRLNKKVALIGSLVFVFLVLAAIAVILYLSRSPEKFIKDGDAALQAAREAVDEQTKEEQYKIVERCYNKARGLAKTDTLRVELIFKLADMFIEIGQWRNVLGCWNGIIQVEPKNIKARYGRLKYLHITADSGLNRVWQEIASHVSELIEVVEDANLLMEDTAKWESFPTSEVREQAQKQLMGPYLYLLQGRAHLEMARRGAVTDPNQSLDLAIDNLQKVQELQPDNINAYPHLAQAIETKGEILASRGNLEERNKSLEQAKKLLEDAVEIASSDVEAHINLLRMKRKIAVRTGATATEVKELLQSLEPEYLSLVQKFPSSAEAYLELAGFYWHDHKSLDKALEFVDKACELDPENAAYAINATKLHYRKFSIYGQQPEIHKAIEIARKALTLPDAQEVSGPRQWANQMNRIALYSFLANCYIEQILKAPESKVETATESAQKEEWLASAEQAVHEIEQLYGSGEEPQVVKWQGMLELARGNRSSAISKLYAIYEQLKAASKQPEFERVDSLLAYRLAKFFENTVEIGATGEFLRTALRLPSRSVPDTIDETKPEAFLDYADLLLKLRGYAHALRVIDFFESNYWSNERSKMLRIKAYIGAQELDKAEEKLRKHKQNDPNTIKLKLALVQARTEQFQKAILQKQATESSPLSMEWMTEGQAVVELEGSDKSITLQLSRYKDTLATLVEKLLQIEPKSIEDTFIANCIRNVCQNYLQRGQKSKVQDLINLCLEASPDNTMALLYKELLSEPKLDEVSQQRQNELKIQVLSKITDPIQRYGNLGVFYWGNNEPNKAAEEFKKILGISDKAGPVKTGDEEMPESQVPQEQTTFGAMQQVAATHLFEIALEKQDWELAQRISRLARQEDLDEANGTFFAARLAAAKGQYKDALAKIEECLKQRPVFSIGYLLRSEFNAAVGNERLSIEDAQKATSLNPLNGDIARRLGIVLYQNNKKLGDNASSGQIIRTRSALEKAILLNTGGVQLKLLSLYADFISSTQPSKALAIRQHLQKLAPSTENAILLGRLATKIATEETNEELKEALFNIAVSSFKQALKTSPNDKRVLYAFSEYYRARGQEEKAKQLLLESQDQKMLWRYYFRSGQFGNAKRVLEQLYQSEPKDLGIVRGFLSIAQKTSDKEGAKKYSEELLSLEDSTANHIMQIYAFLKVGLVKEAEHKLESFKERYPDNPIMLLLDAWLALKQGRLQKALELINRHLEAHEDNAEAWRLRGEINFRMANHNQAISDLKKCKSLASEPLAQIALAKAYLGVGRIEDAITELENVIDDPQAPAEGRGLLERIYLQQGRQQTLQRFYDKTLEKYPNSILWHNRAGTFAAAKGNLNMAEQLFKRALEKSKKDSQGMTSLDGYLRSLGLSGQLDKVLEEGRKYVDTDLATTAYMRMAEAKLKLGDKANAIQYCRNAADKASGNESLMSYILRKMYTLVGAGDVSKYCKEKLQADPDSVSANMTMFNLMKMQGEYNRALGYIDKCLEGLDPNSLRRDNYIVSKAQVLQLAYSKTSDKNYLDKAIAAYESLLAKMPNNTSVLNNLAYMLAENNERLAKALEYAKRAYEALPNNPNLMDTYAYVLYKNGRYSEAVEFSQAAIQQFESGKTGVPVDVYEHLAQAHEKLGTKAEAIAAYKQALDIISARKTGQEAAKKRISSAIERLLRQRGG